MMGLVFTLLSLTLLAQEKVEFQKTETIKIGSIQPLFVINGIPTSQAQFSLISPDNIAKMEVIRKKDAVLLFGEQGRNGAVAITTKKFQSKSSNRE